VVDLTSFALPRVPESDSAPSEGRLLSTRLASFRWVVDWRPRRCRIIDSDLARLSQSLFEYPVTRLQLSQPQVMDATDRGKLLRQARRYREKPNHLEALVPAVRKFFQASKKLIQERGGNCNDVRQISNDFS